MLRAILGADRASYHDRDVQQSVRHGLPFRELVEQIVSSSPDEIGIHEFDDGATAFHRGANGSRHDGGFGNRRVEEPVVRQEVGQASIDAERTAPFPTFLSVDDDAGVGQRGMQDRLEQAVAEGDCSQRRERLAVGGPPATRFPGVLSDADHIRGVGQRFRCGPVRWRLAARKHFLSDAGAVVSKTGRRGGLRVGCGHEDCIHSCIRFGLDRVRRCRVENAFRNQGIAIGPDRVNCAPSRDFVLGAIGVDVRRRVPGKPVAFHVENGGSLAFKQHLALALNGVGDSKRVRAVDGFRMKGVIAQSGADPCEPVPRHGFAARLSAHGVEVVGEEEENRKEAGIVPEAFELRHAGKVQGFPNRSAACGPVANHRDRDAVATFGLHPERGSGRDAGRRPDNGVVRKCAERREERMHAAPHAAIEADFAHEHLGEEPREQEILGEAVFGLVRKMRLHGAEQGAVAVGFHDRGERVVAQPLDRRQPLCQELPVRAV